MFRIPTVVLSSSLHSFGLRMLSTFTTDMTRNLKVKVVAFDLSLILAGTGEGSQSSSSTASSTPSRPKFDTSQTVLALDNMSMASMDGLDGDATVHRHAAPTTEAPHSGKLITYSAQKKKEGKDENGQTTAESMLPSRKISKEELAAEAAKSAVEYKHKYADKIKMKIAKQAQAQAAVPGGGNILNIATRWLLKEGMGDVLDYTHNRTVKIAALGGYDRSNITITQLKSQLNATQFSFIRAHPLGAATDDHAQLKPWCQDHWLLQDADAATKKKREEERKKLWVQGMNDMEQALKVSRSNILFVSGDETALVIARDNGYYTCRYTGEAKRYGQITTDFKAEDTLQIKDAIDDLIGIALRHSVSFIPFR